MYRSPQNISTHQRGPPLNQIQGQAQPFSQVNGNSLNFRGNSLMRGVTSPMQLRSPVQMNSPEPNVQLFSGNYNVQPRFQSGLANIQQQPIVQQQRPNTLSLKQTQNNIQTVYPTIQPVNPQRIQYVPSPAQQQFASKIEQPIQVVDIKQYEQLWQQRMNEQLSEREIPKTVGVDNSKQIDALESKIREQEQQIEEQDNGLAYYRSLVEELQQNLQDSNTNLSEKNVQVRSLEEELAESQENVSQVQQDLKRRFQQISNLQGELAQANHNVSLVSDQLDRLSKEVKILKEQVGTYEVTMQEQENEITELKQRIEDLETDYHEQQNRLVEMEESSSSQITIYMSEIQTWKQKFMELNREYHQVTEKLMFKEAEFENLQKNQARSKEMEGQNPRQSNLRRSVKGPQQFSPIRGSDYVQSALNEQDLAKISQLTKS